MSIKGWIYCMLQLILRIRMNRHLNFKHWWLFPSSLLSLCVFGVYLFTSFHHKVLLLSKAAGIYINVQVNDVFFCCCSLPVIYIYTTLCCTHGLTYTRQFQWWTLQEWGPSFGYHTACGESRKTYIMFFVKKQIYDFYQIYNFYQSRKTCMFFGFYHKQCASH